MQPNQIEPNGFKLTHPATEKGSRVAFGGLRGHERFVGLPGARPSPGCWSEEADGLGIYRSRVESDVFCAKWLRRLVSLNLRNSSLTLFDTSKNGVVILKSFSPQVDGRTQPSARLADLKLHPYSTSLANWKYPSCCEFEVSVLLPHMLCAHVHPTRGLTLDLTCPDH